VNASQSIIFDFAWPCSVGSAELTSNWDCYWPMYF